MGCKVYFFSSASCQNLKLQEGCDQLFSANHEKRLIHQAIEYRKNNPKSNFKIMVDSGAFSFYQKFKKEGKPIPKKEFDKYVNDYINYLNTYGKEFFCFAGVDSIPDPANVDDNCGKDTWENYLYMYNKLNPEIKDNLVPVFHYQEDFKWLKNMLEYRHKDGSPVSYIGIAAAVARNQTERMQWLLNCMRIIKNSSNPNVKVHAFGVGVKKILEQINVTSTDATSWIMRASYGMIAINDKSYTVSSVHKDNFSGKHYTEDSLACTLAVEEQIKKRGFLVEEVSTDYEKRALFNIKDTLAWVEKLKNQGPVHKVQPISLF